MRLQSVMDSPQLLFKESRFFTEGCNKVVTVRIRGCENLIGCQSNLIDAEMKLCGTLPEVP